MIGLGSHKKEVISILWLVVPQKEFNRLHYSSSEIPKTQKVMKYQLHLFMRCFLTISFLSSPFFWFTKLVFFVSRWYLVAPHYKKGLVILWFSLEISDSRLPCYSHLDDRNLKHKYKLSAINAKPLQSPETLQSKAKDAVQDDELYTEALTESFWKPLLQ